MISRKEAVNLGLGRYFTGKPCKNGHIAERFTIAAACVDCVKKHIKKSRAKEKERFYANKLKNQEKNKEES